MMFNEMVWIQKHAKRTYWASSDLLNLLGIDTMYRPRNPFNFRTQHDFYVTWRDEWDRCHAEHKKAYDAQIPADNILADIGVRAQ